MKWQPLDQNPEQRGEIQNQTYDKLLLPLVYNAESIFRISRLWHSIYGSSAKGDWPCRFSRLHI